jgi:Domain of unknown function (DUF397)
VAVRDPKNRTGPVLVLRAHKRKAFLVGVRAGEFEFPRADAGSVGLGAAVTKPGQLQ